MTLNEALEAIAEGLAVRKANGRRFSIGKGVPVYGPESLAMISEGEYGFVLPAGNFVNIRECIFAGRFAGPKEMSRDPQRIKSFDIDEIIPFLKWLGSDLHLKHKVRALFDGCSVKVTSERLNLFAQKGTVCVSCGAKGVVFWYEDLGNGEPHLNLYAEGPNGELIMMTKDHIIPKAKGGENSMENYQPMCVKCNTRKGDSL